MKSQHFLRVARANTMTAVGSSSLQLFFRGEKLRDMDAFSKSDTYVVLSASNAPSAPPVGVTEVRKNDLNPNFTQAIPVEFFFETRQDFTVRVLDDDGQGPNGDEIVGTGQFQLAHVLGSRDSTLKVPLSPSGTLYVTAKEVSKAGRDTVRLKFRGKALKNMDFMGKSDPFYKFERILPNGTTKLIHQSKPIDDTLDPDFPFIGPLKVADLTSADMNDRNLRFSCFDEDVSGADSMGSFTCSFIDLIEAQRSKSSFMLKDAKGGQFGEIFVDGCDIVHYPSFVDFLRSGLQINLAVSIDFTGSNGNPMNPSSLHYMDPVAPNQYVRAIMSVGDVLLQYDNDRMIPAFGFGAQQPMPSNEITHFFHLNQQPNPYVPGIQGLLDAYAQSIRTMRLAGPTNFAPTIHNVRNLAAQSANTYTILLILTDGDITDMDQTIGEIVETDSVPMSIIIVGVGRGCDFEMMNRLDGDGQRLMARGKRMRRDAVQFVPFHKYEQAPPSALAAEVLREIPNQVVDWALAVGRTPESFAHK